MDNEPNPQGWASHNARRFPTNEYFEDSPTAKLPHLLSVNPDAKRVFYNLNYYANPQYMFEGVPGRKAQVGWHQFGRMMSHAFRASLHTQVRSPTHRSLLRR